MGIYTLLVYSDKNAVLLHKQIYGASFFSIPLAKRETVHAYLFHNQWIGLDEHIDFENGRTVATRVGSQPVEKRVNSRPAKTSAPKEKANPTPKPKTAKKTPKQSNHPKKTVPASNQDEMDLLNFISWEDTQRPNQPPKSNDKHTTSSKKRREQPSVKDAMIPPKKADASFTLDSFLSSMFP